MLIAGTAVLLGVAALWGLWWLWWRLPKREAERLRRGISDPKARADVEDNFRKTIGQLIGGAAVLLGAGIAYYQTRATWREAELSRQAAEVQSDRSVQAARALLISQQVAKGFEDLGSPDPLIAMGGIYALEGVMQDSDSGYRRQALEGLCGFVRERTKDRTQPPDRSKITPQEPPTDLRAALTVIGRRPQDLAGQADLSGAKLWGLVLYNVALGKVNLFGADLEDAHLEHANLQGAHLDHADLDGAHLDHAVLTDAVGVTQAQLDLACGSDVALPAAIPKLTLKPCPLPPEPHP